MKTIEENNKLIAEFMGGKYDKDTRFSIHPDDIWLPIHGIVRIKDVELGKGKITNYHKSWDWLMPVVEKIETTLCRLGDRVGAASKRMGLSEESKDTVEIYLTYDSREEFKGWSWTLAFLYAKDIATSTERKDKKIDAMYEAVVEFIKWYNENKK